MMLKGEKNIPKKERCWPKCLMLNSNLGNCTEPTQIPAQFLGAAGFTSCLALTDVTDCHIPSRRWQQFGSG